MRKFLFLSVILFAFISLRAQRGRDFYLWSKVAIDLKLSESNQIVFSERTDYRTSDSFRELTYIDLAGLHRLTKWYRIGLAFRVAQQPVAGRDIYEYRPQLINSFSWGEGLFRFRGTLRLEQRWFSIGKNHQRLYQKFFVDLPALTSKWIQPAVGDELFYKLNETGLHQARLYAGSRVYRDPLFTVSLYYVWQTSKVLSNWRQHDALSLQLRFRLNSKKVFEAD
ncbi:DUF2490 domain-containing protein [Mangrovibacterium lignilyticum]|uniref:DUF2490 domain-containing protein n=1 Tax=Mangrovibacterium lignilyticum TaxID=2668052 RepID=UPI0013D37860